MHFLAPALKNSYPYLHVDSYLLYAKIKKLNFAKSTLH